MMACPTVLTITRTASMTLHVYHPLPAAFPERAATIAFSASSISGTRASYPTSCGNGSPDLSSEAANVIGSREVAPTFTIPATARFEIT